MSENWQVGDRFVFVRGATYGSKRIWAIGTYGTVLSLTSQRPGYFTVESDLCPYPKSDEWGGWAVHPSWLRKIDDDREVGSWDESVWQPDQLVTTGDQNP